MVSVFNHSWHIKNLSGQIFGNWDIYIYFTEEFATLVVTLFYRRIFFFFKIIKRSPVLFLYAVCVSVVRLEGPEYWESPLSENCGVVEVRLQSLILEKV